MRVLIVASLIAVSVYGFFSLLHSLDRQERATDALMQRAAARI
ncbi:hypothetical protein [Burkholderia sp. Ac-20345]|nr:hypothetical protein [Burkholderia sp. Ac-20345]